MVIQLIRVLSRREQLLQLEMIEDIFELFRMKYVCSTQSVIYDSGNTMGLGAVVFIAYFLQFKKSFCKFTTKCFIVLTRNKSNLVFGPTYNWPCENSSLPRFKPIYPLLGFVI